MEITTKVYILYTGGTVGMAPKKADDPYSPLEPKPLTELTKYLSDEFKRIEENGGQKLRLKLSSGNIIEFGTGSFEQPVDSSDISPADWKRMAEMIRNVYDQYDAFIILHGTDTMAFTASGLSFIFENLAKPVIITGSQLPICATRTDAVLNFVNAIYVAGYKATDLPLIPEVVIVFADKIIRGSRASKVSTADWAGFDSPNFPLLGTIGEHININTNYVMAPPPANRKFFIKTDLVDDVFNISIFPGFTNKQMEKIFLDEDVQGIVMRTYGTGNVPNNESFLETIGKAVEQGKLIVNITQCGMGMVEMGLYEASTGLMERGAISGLDMTPEATLAKLMWTLGTQFGPGRITQMQISQRGEQTENLFDLRFGQVKQEEELPKGIFTAAVSPDGRLNRQRISRAMLRISDLGIEGLEQGEETKLKVFMNMPSANYNTPESEERCVCVFDFRWNGKIETKMRNITYKTQNVIGEGDVILTLVPESKDVKIHFSGLYIAVYAKA